jgi:hypothetical protein
MHVTDDELILHYYGELDAAAGKMVADHLHTCDPCGRSLARLQRVLAAVETAPAAPVADGFERTVWARLQPELAPGQRKWLLSGLLSSGRLAWVAGAVLLVIVAFFAGRVTQRAPVPQIASSAVVSPGLRERVLLADLGSHLDRSQMMLIEFVSAETPDDLDVSAERQRAERLAADNRLYRQTALAGGNRALAAVLDDLEQVLVDVAASPDALSSADLIEVRQRIEKKGLLFKVRVLSSEVQQRQRQDIRARAGQGSS